MILDEINRAMSRNNRRFGKRNNQKREKNVFEVNPNSQPDLSQYTYCIQRQLKPEARKDIFQFFKKLVIFSMIKSCCLVVNSVCIGNEITL